MAAKTRRRRNACAFRLLHKRDTQSSLYRARRTWDCLTRLTGRRPGGNRKRNIVMITRKRALALVLAFACIGSPALAKPKIVEFDVPGAGVGANQGTMPGGIDAKGDIVGSYIDSAGQYHGFVRKPDGSFTFYDASTSGASGINARRQTTGYAVVSGVQHGFVAASDGTIALFDVADSTSGGGVDINIKKDVAGLYQDANFAVHGFLRNKRGKIAKFDAPGAGVTAGRGTYVSHISRDDLISGYFTTDSNVRHGFVRDAGGTITTVDPAGSIRTSLYSVNDDDTVVGNYRDASSVLHGIIRTVDGAIVTVDAPGAGTGSLQGTSLLGINDRNFTAGVIIDSSNVEHPFLRTPAGKVTVFDPPDAALTSGLGSLVLGINKKNEITGYYYDANGAYHGYVRTP